MSGITCRHILKGHSGAVNCVAFSPNGCTLATGSTDHSIRLWTSRNGRLSHVMKTSLFRHGHLAPVKDVTFSPDGNIMASCSFDHTVRLWHAKTGKLWKTLVGHTQTVSAVAFAPNGKLPRLACLLGEPQCPNLIVENP